MGKRKTTERVTPENGIITISPGYEAFVLAVVLLSILNSCLFFLLGDPQQREVVIDMQGILCVFLMVDAFDRLRRALNKGHFLFNMLGVLYFVGSLPAPFIFILRLIPFWRMARWLRHKDYEALGQVVVRRYAQSTLLAVVLAAILVVEFGSILVLHAEATAANHNIRTAGDALWWAIVTIATVGYGDRYPVTAWGRVIGVITIVVGVGLFTSLASYLAQWFLRQRSVQPPISSTAQLPVTNQASSDGANVTWEQILTLIQAHEEGHRREVEDLRRQLAALQAERAGYVAPMSPAEPPDDQAGE